MIAGDGARGCFQREGMLVLDGYIMEWFTKDGYTIRLESHFCEALEQDLLFTKEEIGIFKHYVSTGFCLMNVVLCKCSMGTIALWHVLQ